MNTNSNTDSHYQKNESKKSQVIIDESKGKLNNRNYFYGSEYYKPRKRWPK